MATIAILKSLHSLDNRQFVRGLSDSERRSRRAGQRIGRYTRDMGRRFHTLTGNVVSLRGALGVLAGSAGIGYLVSQQMKAIDSSAKLADRLNIQTQELTALHRLTELNGESTERMDKSLEAMSRRVGQAAEGFGQAERALEQLNLNAEDLNKMGMAEQFETISREIAKVEEANTRASIAADLFSRQGIGLLNTMDALAEQGLDPTIERLEKTGEAFDAVDAAKVEAANDAVTQMKGSFTGMARIVTIELADPIKAVADSIDDAMTGSGEAQQAIRDMTNSAVRGIAQVMGMGASVADFVEQNPTTAQFGLVGYVLFGKRGALIGAAIGKIVDDAERQLAKLGVGLTDAAAKVLTLEDRIKGEKAKLEFVETDRAAEIIEQRIADLEEQLVSARAAMEAPELDELDNKWLSNEKSVNSLGGALRSLQQTLLDSLDAAGSGGDSFGAITGLRENMERGDSGAGGGGSLAADEMEEQQKKLDVIRESMMTEMELQQTHFEREQEFLRTAHEDLFDNEVERKNMLLQLERSHEQRKFEIQSQAQGALLQQQLHFLSQMEAAQKTSGAAQIGIMSNAFAQITAAGAQHNKEMFELNKTAGVANAIVATYQGAAEALKAGPFIGPALAAMVVASGMAKVQAIRSQSFSGGGGAAPSTSAGGGVPAVQSVGSQGQAQQEPRRQNITVSIAGDDDRLLSKRQLRQLMEGMQEELDDDASIGNVRIA